MIERDAVIVGGGISGIAIAHLLARGGCSVELWESADRIGGKIRSSTLQGYTLERAASMVMNFRAEVDDFIDDAGLASSKVLRVPGEKRYVLSGRRLAEVPASVGALLRNPILSTAGKLRLLAEPLVARGSNPDESVADFVARRLGHEFLEKVFEPYLAGPLASDADRAEAAATIPRLVALEKRYGSLALGFMLRKCLLRGDGARPQAFTFRGGMETLIARLAVNGGFRICTGLRASEIRPIRGGWQVAGSDGTRDRTVEARHLIMSTPAYSAAELLRHLDDELAGLLGAIEYAPIRVVHAGFDRSRVKHSLDGSGFLLPRRSGFEANGCLWISELFPEHAPPQHTLFTSYLGGARNPAAIDWSEPRCLGAVMPMLRHLLDVDGDPEMVHIETHRYGLPLYHGNYSARLARINARLRQLPGLYLEANYRGGVSVRDRILTAQAVARRILQQRHAKTGSRPMHDGAPVLAGATLAPGALR